jgi:hypothetical protein
VSGWVAAAVVLVVVVVAWCVLEAATHAVDVLVVVDVRPWVVVVVDATFSIAQFVPTKVTKGM